MTIILIDLVCTLLQIFADELSVLRSHGRTSDLGAACTLITREAGNSIVLN